MIVKPALAAMLATGLIVPEAPKLILPKPAIVRAENLEFSKHMLLGMPITMGMLPGKSTPASVSFVQSLALTGLSSGSRSVSMSIGAAASSRVVILGVLHNDSRSSGVSNVTIGGVAATQRATQTNASGSILYFFTALVISGTTATVDYFLGGTCAALGFATFRATDLANVVPAASGSSVSDPGSVTLTVPPGGFAVAISMSGSASGPPTASWQNATEQFEQRPSGQNTTFSGALRQIGGSATISCDWSNSTSGGRATLAAAWL